MWRNRVVDIVILCSALLFLTAIFFFQDFLVRRPVLYDRVRLGFLVFTLFWIGWYVHAQLSVVNVLTFVNALRTDFRWDYFLIDPLIFILWFGVAASMLFWGRGAFCGWLCPFGALQELLNRAAKALRLPQIQVPFGVHQRLWPIKYMIFLLLFGLSLYSLSLGEEAAEVEPFKTAIVLHFARHWPFVLFALAVLGSGTLHRAVLLPLCLPARSSSREFRRACACSTGSGATGNAAIPASAAGMNAPCRPSTPKGTSIPTNASNACTARCSITTPTSVRL